MDRLTGNRRSNDKVLLGLTNKSKKVQRGMTQKDERTVWKTMHEGFSAADVPADPIFATALSLISASHVHFSTPRVTNALNTLAAPGITPYLTHLAPLLRHFLPLFFVVFSLRS